MKIKINGLGLWDSLKMKNTLTDLIKSDENLTNGIASMEHAKKKIKLHQQMPIFNIKMEFSIIEETLGSI
ncbi:MAG: hypothetical protein ACLR43_10550 [Faecalibacillus faecis]